MMKILGSPIRKVALSLLLLALCTSYTMSNSQTSVAQPIAQSAEVYINGQLISEKVQVVKGGHWLIAARTYLPALGATFAFDRNSQLVRSKRGTINISCKIGSTTATLNGKPYRLPTPCAIRNGQPWIPLRAFSEAFRVTVGWQGTANIITVSSAPLTRTSVTRVIDGDTVEIRWGNGTERIRLIGVDTPETVHPRLGEEPFGREASHFTKQSLTGKTVFIEFDVEPRDKYGRLLGYAYLTDGTFFNARLIGNGYAQMMTYPPNVRYVNLFRALQTNARNKSLGLWGIDEAQGNTIPSVPAQYNQKSGCKNPLIKGNINSKKDKIYHVPGGDYYNITKPEQWFCNEQEALNAGFRKSRK